MGLFGRFFGKERDGKAEGGPRCMECGMTGGEHTDWCPIASTHEPDTARDAAAEEPAEAKSPRQSRP